MKGKAASFGPEIRTW